MTVVMTDILGRPIARGTHLKALVAAIDAARLAPGCRPARRCSSCSFRALHQCHCLGSSCCCAGERPVDRWRRARRTDVDGRAACLSCRARHLDWSWVADSLGATDLWDDDAWLELASSQVELARATGALLLLSFALDDLAAFHIQGGNPSLAPALSRRPRVPTWRPCRDAALRSGAARGVASGRLPGLGSDRGDDRRRRQPGAEDARSRLRNTPRLSCTTGLVSTSLHSRPHRRRRRQTRSRPHRGRCPSRSRRLRRSGRQEIARESLDQLRERTGASGTTWAKGRRRARARARCSRTVNRPSICIARRSKRSEPAEFGCGRFDLGPGPERAPARVDIVAAGNASQELASVAHT
jgi:hypothetical protein